MPNLYNESSGFQHLYGVGIRDVFNVSSKLRLDYGVRVDGSSYQIVNDPGTISNEGKHPRVTEPRFASAYQFGRNDAVRASYGRSVQFTPAGSLNSPLLTPSQFVGIPSRDSRTGLPSMTCGAPKFTSQCKDYAQQIHDEQVAFFGLEAFDVKPATVQQLRPLVLAPVRRQRRAEDLAVLQARLQRQRLHQPDHGAGPGLGRGDPGPHHAEQRRYRQDDRRRVPAHQGRAGRPLRASSR